MNLPRRSSECGEVADVRDDGCGLVGAIGTVAALLTTGRGECSIGHD